MQKYFFLQKKFFRKKIRGQRIDVFSSFQSTTPELRADKLEHLLKFYHSKLLEYLARLGEDPTGCEWETLRKDFEECFAQGLMLALFNVQVMISNT